MCNAGPRDTISAACAHEINNPLMSLNLLYLVKMTRFSKQTHLYRSQPVRRRKRILRSS